MTDARITKSFDDMIREREPHTIGSDDPVLLRQQITKQIFLEWCNNNIKAMKALIEGTAAVVPSEMYRASGGGVITGWIDKHRLDKRAT
jgi:hypothetical protein